MTPDPRVRVLRFQNVIGEYVEVRLRPHDVKDDDILLPDGPDEAILRERDLFRVDL